jgi:hypothetical protein
MSDETYYTVLNVKETASPAEIKTAYRDLIRQVHPDTIANLAPFLRRIAEEKAKEIIEAHTVLSSPVKRREYDRQLAEYRRQSTPPTPSRPTPPPPTPAPHHQATSRPTSWPLCKRCGTSLYGSGFCPKCSKFTTPTTPPQPKVVRWLGYNWSPLMRWAREHPFIVVFATLFAVVFISSFILDADTSQSSANISQSPVDRPPSTNNTAAASTGLYSKYPCDFRDKISPIDGKPCRQPDLSGLTSSERQSIEAACSHAKYVEGPAAYDGCLVRQLEAWTVGPKQPDLSSLTFSKRQSVEAECSHAKYIEGPAAYDRCLVRQLGAHTNYRQ